MNDTGREGRTLVLGDVHGAHRALLQVFERAAVDPNEDHLIVLGDVADGWPDVSDCIETLLAFEQLTILLGNHDEWFRDWALSGTAEDTWLSEGGLATFAAYDGEASSVPDTHIRYLLDAKDYFIDDRNRCYVHAGLDPQGHPELAPGHDLRWSRSFWHLAVSQQFSANSQGDTRKLTEFDLVFLGHTPTHRNWPDRKPVQACNVWNLDQGAGWDGKLTLMDVDTNEYWQSDDVPTLYPGVTGRFD